MKGITSFINENTKTNSTQFINEIKAVLDGRLISKFRPYKGENDKNRFAAQDYNAKLICDEINKRGLYQAVTIAEYYKIHKKTDMYLLSPEEYADIDAKYGDIIFIDKNNLPLCKFDLKVSSENSDYTGSISLGSLVKFDINGWYICCCIKTGKYKIISHKKAFEYAKYPGNLRQPSENHKYKGYSVPFNGKNLTSEWWISSASSEL